MKHFLRFLGVLFMSVNCSTADRIQNFLDELVKLHNAYELQTPSISITQFWESLDFLVGEYLKEEDIRYILKAEVPSPEKMPKLLKKHCTQLERIIFVKILLLALTGWPRQADALLWQLDYALLQTDVAIVPKHPWIILMYCIGISYRLNPMEYCVQTTSTAVQDDCVITGEEEDYLQSLETDRVEREGMMEIYDDVDELLKNFYKEIGLTNALE